MDDYAVEIKLISNLRQELKSVARNYEKLKAENGKQEQTIRALQHELLLRDRTIAELRSK